MSNLLKSDFYKLFKMKSFYVCCIISAAIAAVTMILNSAINNMLDSVENMAGVASSKIGFESVLASALSPTGDWFILVIIGVSLFVTIEYNAGTLKNIAARGFKRENIFFSKLIVCIVESFIIALSFAVSDVIFGMIFIGLPSNGFTDGFFAELLAIYGTDILIIAGYSCFIAMVAYLIRSNGGTIAVTLCVHYLIPVVITMFNVTNMISSETESELEKLVSYSTNPYGNIAYFWIGTLGSTVAESYQKGTIYIPILAALAYMILSCGIGLSVFKKRDIK